MAGFRIVPRSAVGGLPEPMAQPFRGTPTAQPDNATAARLAALEENMRRMHAAYQQLATEHQKLKAATQNSVRSLAGRDQILAGHFEQMATAVGYSPQPQGPGNTPGVPTHAMRNPNVGVVGGQQAAQQYAQQAGAPGGMAPPPQAQSAQQTVQSAAEELFYGSNDADAIFYSGGEGES